MNLLAETYLTLASYPPARGKEVVKAKLSEATLMGQDIPDRFWLELLQLNQDLVFDVLPDVWEPSAFVWNDAISNYQDQPDVLRLLLKRYGSKIKFDELTDHGWEQVSDFLAESLTVTLASIAEPKNLTNNKLRWLSVHAQDVFEKVCIEHSKIIMSNQFLIGRTPISTLKAWSRVKQGTFEYPLWAEILKRILPHIEAPYYDKPEVSIHLIGCIQDTNSRPDTEPFVEAFSKLQSEHYMAWVNREILVKKTRGSSMWPHWSIIADNQALWPFITKELELLAFIEPCAHNRLDTRQYQWQHIQRIAEVKESTAATAEQLVLSVIAQDYCKNRELFFDLIKTVTNFEPAAIKVETRDVEVFDATVNVCTPKAKEMLLHAGLSASSDMVAHVLCKYDVSNDIPTWTFPKSSFWINSLKKLHPANLAALLTRIGEPENNGQRFSEINELHRKLIQLHPKPELNLLVQAIVSHYSEFQTKHLTDIEFNRLFKTAQIAQRRDALTTLRRQKRQRKKSTV